MDVETHDDLQTKTSGVIVNEIYGQDSPSDSSTLRKYFSFWIVLTYKQLVKGHFNPLKLVTQ